jgi:hypothetical protein
MKPFRCIEVAGGKQVVDVVVLNIDEKKITFVLPLINMAVVAQVKDSTLKKRYFREYLKKTLPELLQPPIAHTCRSGSQVIRHCFTGMFL